MFDKTRKNVENFFFTGKTAFFKKFDFKNLLGAKELIFLLPQYLPEYLVDPDKMFPEVCHTR